MKIKRSYVIAAIIIVVVGIAWVKGFWFTEVFRTHQSNEPHRTALLQIRDAVAVGASRVDVLAAYWQHRTDALRLFADRPSDWVITMPLEFGASDGKLLIEFQDGGVTAVRVRTSDGPPPRDGPEDKQKKAR
ncbi:MAG TPA: hypothetical protein PKI20_16310 [Verrucomicrobiota bacterium]|nr:hypothetical protein [Verrucomicrobiota bacterium]